MAHPNESSAPSLELIFETIHGFQRTGALKAALELDVFTAIGEGADTAEMLAARVGASAKGVRILCDYLTVMGLLTKSGQSYGLTGDSGFFLDRRSPAFMGTAVDFLLAPPQTEPFLDLSPAVRSGGARDEGVVAPDHPVWVKFARAMAPLMAFPSELVAGILPGDTGRKLKLLDIATGHGLYGLAVGKRFPNAEIVAVDSAGVLEVAAENARAAGLADRFRPLAGSAFDVDFGSGYDIVLVVNFLHHFDSAAIENFLRKIHGSMNAGGYLAIVEFIPNEDRVSPRVPAQFSMMMLACTPGGDAYTYSEYKHLLGAAGFVSSELHDLPPTYFRAVLARA